MCFFPLLIAEMTQCCALYKTRIRVDNNIHEVILSAQSFEDVRVRGESSSVIMNLQGTSAISAVVGKFKNSVEILSVEPYNDQNVESQAMETEVTYIYLFKNNNNNFVQCTV